jgi:hypothetical protein
MTASEESRRRMGDATYPHLGWSSSHRSRRLRGLESRSFSSGRTIHKSFAVGPRDSPRCWSGPGHGRYLQSIDDVVSPSLEQIAPPWAGPPYRSRHRQHLHHAAAVGYARVLNAWRHDERMLVATGSFGMLWLLSNDLRCRDVCRWQNAVRGKQRELEEERQQDSRRTF